MFNSSNPDPSFTSSRVKATGCQLDPGMRPISGGARTDQGQQMEKPREKRDEEQINGEWKARGWGGDVWSNRFAVTGCWRPPAESAGRFLSVWTSP